MSELAALNEVYFKSRAFGGNEDEFVEHLNDGLVLSCREAAD